MIDWLFIVVAVVVGTMISTLIQNKISSDARKVAQQRAFDEYMDSLYEEYTIEADQEEEE